MRRPLKISLIVVAAIIVLIVAAVIILPMVINPNDYRDEITSYVKEKTGRQLTIQGDIRLSVFPWLGADIGPMQLGNAPGFGNEPFASIRQTDVHVRLLPLIFGQIKVGDVRIDGLTLNLARSAAGKTNWADLVKAPSAGTQAAGPGSPLANLAIHGLQIRDGLVSWTDAKAHRSLKLEQLTLDMGNFAPGSSLPLTAGFDLHAKNPSMDGTVKFATRLIVSPDANNFELHDTSLDLSGKTQWLPGADLASHLGIASATVDLAQGTMRISGVVVQSAGMEIDVDAAGSGIPAQPAITGTLKVPSFSPREVMSALGKKAPQTADPKVLQNASGSLAFQASGAALSLSDITFKLDDTSLSGKVGVNSFSDPKITFDLDLDQLNADRYLPPGGKTAGKAGESGNLDEMRVPVATVRKLKLDGKLEIGSLQAFGVKSQQVSLRVQAGNGKLSVGPVAAKLYGGSYTGRFAVDASGQVPRVAAASRLLNVQIGSLGHDFLGSDRLSGTGDVQAEITGEGRKVGEIRRSMNGKTAFELKNGALEGIDLQGQIERAWALYKRESPPKLSGPQRTEFVSLSGTGNIVRGVLKNNDLVADLRFLKLTGHGSLNLVTTDLDYTLKAEVTAAAGKSAPPALQALQGKSVPLRLAGKLGDLTARPEIGQAVKERVKEKAQEKLQEKLKSLFPGPPPG